MGEQGKKSKKKKHTGLIWFLVVLGIMIISTCVFVYAELESIAEPENSAVVLETPEGDETVVQQDYTYQSNVPAVKGVTNILLIGQDRRPGEERARSDSMILCSMNENTHQITMVSLMRDMYIPIPGYGSNRINAAYAFGGMPLLDQTIEDNFGVHIDGNAEVDFEGFMKLIDKMDGVDIDLTAEEAEYLNTNNTGLVDGVTRERWNLVPGVNTLNAEQALAYARTRFIGNSDWERTDRQRTVLAKIAEKVKSLDPISQVSLIHSALDYMTTDIGTFKMLELGFKVIANDMNLSNQSYRLPVEGTYTSQSIEGMSVLVPDTAANASYLKQYIGIQ